MFNVHLFGGSFFVQQRYMRGVCEGKRECVYEGQCDQIWRFIGL